LGTSACGGTFTAAVSLGGTITVGELPAGKKDIYASLQSPVDVDLQLYDLDETACTGDRKAIIAHSEEAADGSCEKGTLGNNGSMESTTYKERVYEYSGCYGEGNEATYGNEYIRVQGVLNTKLLMKAYGHAAGEAVVNYGCYEGYTDPNAPPTEPAVDWLAGDTTVDHKTDVYKDVPSGTLIVRRGQSFSVVAGNAAGILAAHVTARVVGTKDDGEGAVSEEVYPLNTHAELNAVQVGDNKVVWSCTLAPDAPVATYTLTLAIGAHEASQTLIVLANPYASKDVAHTTQVNRAEYVENTEGLVWQGLSDKNNGRTWAFGQFEWAILVVALQTLP
jgi:hypothetical protein